MISRRALLGTGAATAITAAALGGAALTHRLDDLARGVGIKPHPEPDPSDSKLLARVAVDQNTLLAMVEATAGAHSTLKLDRYLSISTSHAKAVGVAASVPDVAPPSADPETAVSDLSSAYANAARARAADALEAASPALVRVLASMSAGLYQCADAIKDLR
ncbi:hypothetical protein J2X11_002223 [Aeromicrobium panaciterrae]|uniref:Uncharacterized protein n=1 Tax=Aeromicrobium panaciterrae TaxID=363861 RepID=A0ABU1UQC8_9ACTN|nr:hypothetical protein [Aeromicrobium panaciterrae]MDR7087384.1 hypothetical protein [Aeromicrobium panaciterrae]